MQKKELPKGIYLGDFFGTYQLNNGTTQEKNLLGVQFEITETDENHIFISGAILEKDGEKIKGILNKNFYNGHLITIDGKWRKENGNYIIEGDFTSSYIFMNYQPMLERDITGKFKIESTF